MSGKTYISFFHAGKSLQKIFRSYNAVNKNLSNLTSYFVDSGWHIPCCNNGETKAKAVAVLQKAFIYSDLFLSSVRRLFAVQQLWVEFLLLLAVVRDGDLLPMPSGDFSRLPRYSGNYCRRHLAVSRIGFCSINFRDRRHNLFGPRHYNTFDTRCHDAFGSRQHDTLHDRYTFFNH